jgi:hypothetical protein
MKQLDYLRLILPYILVKFHIVIYMHLHLFYSLAHSTKLRNGEGLDKAGDFREMGLCVPSLRWPNDILLRRVLRHQGIGPELLHGYRRDGINYQNGGNRTTTLNKSN